MTGDILFAIFEELKSKPRTPDRTDATMKTARTTTLLLAVTAICAGPPAARAQAEAAQTSQSANGNKSYAIDIDASKQWIDTSIDLRAGEKLHITATGTITYPSANPSKSPDQSLGPAGLARGFRDLIH